MNWHIIWQFRYMLLDGLLTTLWLSAVGIIGSLIVGAIVGCCLSTSNFWLRRLSALYVEVLRNIPTVVKLFFFYFAVNLEALPAALLTLILHQSAFIADVVAAGVRTVPLDQQESARALGHGTFDVFFWIVLPSALPTMIPPLTTQFIETVKTTAIVMSVGIAEMTYRTKVIEHETFRGFEAATAVTLLYLCISLCIAFLMQQMHHRIAKR